MDFTSGVTFDPQPSLQQGELDLVMTSDILPRSGLHYSPMFDYEVRLVLAPDHPLASKTRITPEDLATETLLIYPVQRSRLDIWRHFLQLMGISPQLKSVDNTLLLIQMVAARMGIAALPHWVVESFERQGLVVTKTLGEGLWVGCTPPCAMASSVSRSRKRLFAQRGTTRATIFRLCGARSDPTAMYPQRSQDHRSPIRKLGQWGCCCQIARFTSSPAGTCTLFMMPSVPAVYLSCAIVPHEVPQSRGHHTQPDQNAPLHGGGR